MIELGLIGYPLEHSFSPEYFSEKFCKSGVEGKYSLFPIESISSLPELLDRNPELLGLNVTIPYKQEVIRFLNEIDDSVREIGAVNTVKIERKSDGRNHLSGYNTDWIGFTESLRPLITGKEIRQALILGTGGAAHAVSYALLKLGIEPTFVSRNPESSSLTPAITYSQISNQIMNENQLVVNTSPVGMFPNTDECPEIPYDSINPNHILYDLIYNPLTTEFLKQGEKRGATVKNGLEMLHLQADSAFQIWTTK